MGLYGKKPTALDEEAKRLIREEFRAEVREAIRQFKDMLSETTRSAQALSRDLFGISAHQAQIEASARASHEAHKTASELRAEWIQAKALAKIFEQRAFLNLPQVRDLRQELLGRPDRLAQLGAGAASGLMTENDRLQMENNAFRLRLAELEAGMAKGPAAHELAQHATPAPDPDDVDAPPPGGDGGHS